MLRHKPEMTLSNINMLETVEQSSTDTFDIVCVHKSKTDRSAEIFRKAHISQTLQALPVRWVA